VGGVDRSGAVDLAAGANHFTTTIKPMDIRIGGVWNAGDAWAGWNGPSNKTLFKGGVAHEQRRFSLNGGKRNGPAVQFEMVATFEDTDTAGVRLN
jgi:hypothetical protein